MGAKYDPEQIRRFYDDFGEREWERLEANPRARVIYHVHRWYLQQFVKPGHHVLDAGAGPGRFTIELAKLGATVTVGDISPRQLDLNRTKVQEVGLETQVRQRVLLDIVDCSQFPAESFDAVVCYGSPLSYVYERANDALGEMLRVTKRDGHLLLSVTSRLNLHVPLLIELVRSHGVDAAQQYFDAGHSEADADDPHPMHCYKWSELQALLERHPVEIVAVSASNLLAKVSDIQLLKQIESEPAFWEAFLRWEVSSSKEPGVIDAGSHIIAVVRRL